MIYRMLLFIGVTGATGDILLYQWAKTNRAWTMAAGLGCWIACLIAFAFFMRSGSRSLGVTFVIIAAIHTVIVLGWDYAWVGTRLTAREVIGTALAIVGVLLIESKQ